MTALMQPTPDEVRNGWDAETLTAYLAEREKAQFENQFNRPKPRPDTADSDYDPHAW